MAERPKRPPSEVLQGIERQATAVREAANAVSGRIEQFEHYLANLPGRVETTLHVRHPDGGGGTSVLGETTLAIRLARDGSTWKLVVGTSHVSLIRGFDPTIEWRPLVDAPLKWKVAAVKSFPDFLTAVEKSQAELVEELNSVVADYDHFASGVIPPPKIQRGKPLGLDSEKSWITAAMAEELLKHAEGVRVYRRTKDRFDVVAADGREYRIGIVDGRVAGPEFEAFIRTLAATAKGEGRQ